MKKLVLVLVSFIFILKLSYASTYSSDPEKFISEIVAEAKLILNSQASKQEKAEKLSLIAINTVDVKGIGYYTLGKKKEGNYRRSKEKVLCFF